MARVLALFAALFVVLATFAAPASARSLSLPPPFTCNEELVGMTQCIPYLREALNIAPAEPSDCCCKTLLDAAESDTDDNLSCICHVVRKNSLFGFPLNATRTASILPFCHGGDRRATAAAINEVCRVENALAPQHDSVSVTDGAPSAPPSIEAEREKKVVTNILLIRIIAPIIASILVGLVLLAGWFFYRRRHAQPSLPQ